MAEQTPFRQKIIKTCPKCGNDVILETAWDGSAQPILEKCEYCGYRLKPRLRDRIKAYFR